MFDDTKTTVIVVDDDAGLCASLEMLLAAAGYVCASYGSAEAYLKRAAAGRPGCILLDIELPGMSGLELQRMMRTQASDPPIVFLTGSGREDDARQARAGGAAAFLHKPVDPDQLLDQIARVTAGP
ncbi:response regulator transcription factor [Salinisphaera sp. SWV1]|uniref:response regulator transcription factor n=1 Tax=Salinisphaera sp. SWV1 TaxID=3454139 RepID=UPI003F83C086